MDAGLLDHLGQGVAQIARAARLAPTVGEEGGIGAIQVGGQAASAAVREDALPQVVADLDRADLAALADDKDADVAMGVLYKGRPAHGGSLGDAQAGEGKEGAQERGDGIYLLGGAEEGCNLPCVAPAQVGRGRDARWFEDRGRVQREITEDVTEMEEVAQYGDNEGLRRGCLGTGFAPEIHIPQEVAQTDMGQGFVDGGPEAVEFAAVQLRGAC